MSAWPQLKTAHDIALERILPCSEDQVRALAKAHGIGRKLGRQYVFQASDIEALIEKLPCPSSSSPDDTAPRIGTSAGLSEDAALTKAQDLLTRLQRKKSSSSGRRKSSNGPSMVIALPARSQKRS